MAIGIGLNHSYVAHVRRQGSLNALQVALEGGQINLGPAAVREGHQLVVLFWINF